MDGDVDLIAQHRLLDLLDEQSLPPHHGQGDIEDLVPLGLDLGQGDLHPRVALFQLPLDPVGLPESQLTGAGSDTQQLFAHGLNP